MYVSDVEMNNVTYFKLRQKQENPGSSFKGTD